MEKLRHQPGSNSDLWLRGLALYHAGVNLNQESTMTMWQDSWGSTNNQSAPQPLKKSYKWIMKYIDIVIWHQRKYSLEIWFCFNRCFMSHFTTVQIILRYVPIIAWRNPAIMVQSWRFEPIPGIGGSAEWIESHAHPLQFRCDLFPGGIELWSLARRSASYPLCHATPQTKEQFSIYIFIC